MVSQALQVFVAIDAHPKSGMLLRAAATKAKELNCGWTVIYVETPDHDAGSNESRQRILQYMTQAEEMGAAVQHIVNNNVVDSILSAIEQARMQGVAVHTLKIGKTQKEGFWAELKSSTAEKLAQALQNSSTSVQIIPLSGASYRPSWFERLQLGNIRVYEIFFALGMVILAYILSEVLKHSITMLEWQVNVHNVTSFFLIATIISALRYGMLPGLIAAVASFICLNYFYVKPLYNFGLEHSGEAVSLTVFLLSAVFVSIIGAYTRASATSAMRKERRSQALHTLYRNASEAGDRQHALEVMHQELSQMLEMQVAFFLPKTMNPDELELAYPDSVEMDERDHRALLTCWERMRVTGLGATMIPLDKWRFEPMVTPKGEIGVFGIRVPREIRLDASFGRLLSALADQAANILERIELTKLMSESRVREEREKLRAMLLSSVSHDLKTPLASIIGSLSVYKRMKKAGRLDSETSDELTETALDEAQRLDSFISNILDMTRIESGDISFNADWVSLDRLINSVQKRLRLRLRDHEVNITLPDEPFEVYCDRMMMEQVLQNVMDNAAKYSPKQSTIHVAYWAEDEGLVLTVRDEGAGIPDDKCEAVFDKYERLKQSDSKVAGTGLGLAICRAIIEKQGGTIVASNHSDGGAQFTIRLPNTRRSEERGEAA